MSKWEFDFTGAVQPWTLLDYPKETPILLALSGGADSCALLHLLREWQKDAHFPLLLAHINHNIRGEEAIRDRDFCISLANQYGVELCILEADVPVLAKASGRSLEEEAREVRYRYFAELMQQRQIPILVTAHHADDNLETILFRMSRGTGARGLGGIAPYRPFASGFLVRPLLSVSKRSILEYCQKNCLAYVTDSTNFDNSPARNRIRNRVVPELEALFPNVQEHVSQLSLALREDEELLSSIATRFLEEHCQENRIFLAAFDSVAAPIRKRVLLRFAETSCGTMIETVHLDALVQMVSGHLGGAEVALPNQFFCRIENQHLCISRSPRQQPRPFFLPVCEGSTVLESSNIHILVKKTKKNKKIHNLSTHPHLSLTVTFDIMKDSICWRNLRQGDKILLRGVHRKLRRLYAEAGVDVVMRRSIPLLCDGDDILWAPLIGSCDRIKQMNENQNFVYSLQVELPTLWQKEGLSNDGYYGK